MATSAPADAGEPMVVDQGQRGLESSRHHPAAGTSALAPDASAPAPQAGPTPAPKGTGTKENGAKEDIKEIMKTFIGLIIPGKEVEAERAFVTLLGNIEKRVEKRVKNALPPAQGRKEGRVEGDANGPITRAELAAVVRKAVEEAVLKKDVAS